MIFYVMFHCYAAMICNAWLLEGRWRKLIAQHEVKFEAYLRFSHVRIPAPLIRILPYMAGTLHMLPENSAVTWQKKHYTLWALILRKGSTKLWIVDVLYSTGCFLHRGATHHFVQGMIVCQDEYHSLFCSNPYIIPTWNHGLVQTWRKRTNCMKFPIYMTMRFETIMYPMSGLTPPQRRTKNLPGSLRDAEVTPTMDSPVEWSVRGCSLTSITFM